MYTSRLNDMLSLVGRERGVTSPDNSQHRMHQQGAQRRCLTIQLPIRLLCFPMLRSNGPVQAPAPLPRQAAPVWIFWRREGGIQSALLGYDHGPSVWSSCLTFRAQT